MELDRLIAALGPAEVANAAPVEIVDLAYDTRAVVAGSLFFCVPGSRVDGHDLAPAGGRGRRRGARRRAAASTLPVPQLVVPSVRAAMPVAANAFFGDPSRELDVAAVTGTNGKTTTAFLLALDPRRGRPAARRC